jgi:hypothetical protein
MMKGALSDERTSLPFTTAAGPHQCSYTQVRVPWDSWPYSHRKHSFSYIVVTLLKVVFTGRCIDGSSSTVVCIRCRENDYGHSSIVTETAHMSQCTTSLRRIILLSFPLLLGFQCCLFTEGFQPKFLIVLMRVTRPTNLTTFHLITLTVSAEGFKLQSRSVDKSIRGVNYFRALKHWNRGLESPCSMAPVECKSVIAGITRSMCE